MSGRTGRRAGRRCGRYDVKLPAFKGPLRIAGLVFIGATVIVVGCYGWGIYVISRPHPSEGDEVIAIPERSEHTLSKTVPKSVKRVRYGHSSAGFTDRCLLYRIEAPLEECLRHADREFGAHWDKPSQFVTNQIANLKKDGRFGAGPPMMYGFKDLTWFDPQRIENGLEIVNRGGFPAHIWIDTDRNMLFFLMSN